MNPKIVSETPIDVYALHKEIKKIKKRDEELNIRANKTEEYLNDFVELKQKDYDELQKELLGLNIPRLKDKHIMKIIDLLPGTVEELKVILQGYIVTISKDNMKKISGVVKKYIS